jgi:hypothetical protein
MQPSVSSDITLQMVMSLCDGHLSAIYITGAPTATRSRAQPVLDRRNRECVGAGSMPQLIKHIDGAPVTVRSPASNPVKGLVRNAHTVQGMQQYAQVRGTDVGHLLWCCFRVCFRWPNG